MAAIEVPPQRVRDDGRVDLRLTRRALEQANDRLDQSRGWYSDVRRAFSKR